MEEIAPILIIGMYLGFIALEALRPRRKLEPVRHWRKKGVLFFVITAVVSTVLPLAWGDALSRHALLNLSGLGTVAGAAVGYVVFQLAAYWWHRLEHTSPSIPVNRAGLEPSWNQPDSQGCHRCRVAP